MPSNVSAAIRALACLVTGFFLLKFTVLNEHLRLRPLGVVLVLVFEGLLLAAATLIFLKDAKPPPPNVLHFDTRAIKLIQELIISAGAAMFGVFGLYLFTCAGADEVWAGEISTRGGPKPMEYGIAAFFLVTAFFGVFFRPSFTIDLARRTIQRFPFGRALPLRQGPVRPSGDIRIVSEGYFITNTGVRLGEMIRGTIGKNTFELELLRLPYSEAHLKARIDHWKTTLSAGSESSAEPSTAPHPAAP